MDKFEYFTAFLADIAKTSPEHKDLLESVKAGVKLILEAEDDMVPTEGRKIRVYVEEWDEDSKEIGETDEKYWEEETGVSMEPDEFDIDDGKTAVDLAIHYLNDNGPVESDREGKIYRTIDAPMTRDRIERGIDEYRTFFLDNFSDEELEEIKARV